MQAELTELEETAQLCAIVGKSQGLGRTPSEAVNNLLSHLGGTIPTPIVIWPYSRGDEYWSEAQQHACLIFARGLRLSRLPNGRNGSM